MSGLRGKLQRAFGVESPAADSAVGDQLRRHQRRARRALPEVELPDGTVIRNQRGSCFVRRLEYCEGHAHGDRVLRRPRADCWPRIAELARAGDLEIDASQCLFLDTETTGLAGGAGTVVFMCGLGFFVDGGLVVEQVFLRAFAEEAAALCHVARRLCERPVLVTFVGKSFDRHRLAARMTLHRVESTVLTEQHLDLYYLARRAYGSRLPNVKLQTVERQVLGLRRQADMPGAEAPYAFLSWLRDRSGRVDRVFEHNRLDVLSLVALLDALGS